MESLEYTLGAIGEVGHQKFDALSIDIIGALNVILLLDIWHLRGETLLVQVFLRVVRLMLNHVEWYDNFIVTAAFALIIESRISHVAVVEAQIV